MAHFLGRCSAVLSIWGPLLFFLAGVATVGCDNGPTSTHPRVQSDPETDQKVAEIVRAYPNRYGSGEEDDEAREERAEKLRRQVVAIGPQAVASLTKLLDDEELRGRAMQILTEFGPEARFAAPKLLEIIRNDDSAFSIDRLYANEALKKIGGDPSVLAESLESENGTERMAALNAIQGMGNDVLPLLPKLMAIIEDSGEDPVIRMNTAEALATLGPSAAEVVPDLIEVLGETDVYEDPQITVDGQPVILGSVASAAASVLGAIGSKAEAALPALEKLAADESEHNREAAEDAISKIKGGQRNSASVRHKSDRLEDRLDNLLNENVSDDE